MKKRRYGDLIASSFLSLALLPVSASGQGDPAFGYELQRDVVYGQGRIAPEGTEVMRDLKMDVYTPTSAGAGPWPAVIAAAE